MQATRGTRPPSPRLSQGRTQTALHTASREPEYVYQIATVVAVLLLLWSAASF